MAAALRVAENTVCGDGTPPRLAVIAMGKCGARELNYVSDVDVIFVAEHADPVSTRVAGEMMRVASTAFFEVDAGLRPEGRAGELVRTLESHVAYYKRWAKTWEFQALLKARAAVGDAELGERYLAALMPMVWIACEREDFVAEVQAMRRRVEQLVPANVRGRELKLGTGGLRDVEFAVQLLQLVHGRGDESLHVSSTVDALAALSEGGYVGREDAANMNASYEFLRLLEHRLQLQRLKRTHMLPEAGDDEAVRWLARAAHIRPDGRHDAAGVLREELKHQNVRVSRLHAKLFYQPLLESIGPAGLEIVHGMTSEAAERQLAALGYEGPQTALERTCRRWSTRAAGAAGCSRSCCPGCWTGCRTPPTPTAGCWPTGGSARRWPRRAGIWPRCATSPRSPSGSCTCWARPAYVTDLLMRAPEVIQSYCRRAGRAEAARDRTRRRGPGADHLGRPATPTRFGPSPRRVGCADASWPASAPRTCSACSRSPRCARRSPRCGWRCCRPPWTR